jgi:hypothetical protein
MRQIAAHYVFDGKTFHKYSLITLDESNCFVSLASMPSEETAGVEFYSGIVMSFPLSYKKHENPEKELKQQIDIATLQGVAVSRLSALISPFCKGNQSSVLLLENVDLTTLTMTEKTKIRWLV